MIQTVANTTNFIANEYRNEIANLTKGIAYCNDAICSKSILPFEVKEYKSIKLEHMKRKITLIKLLNTLF